MTPPVPDRNDDLWRDHPVGPPIGSRARSRLFWWQHYLIAEYGDGRDLPPAPDRRPWATSIVMTETSAISVSTGLDAMLTFRTGDDGSSVSLSSFTGLGTGELAVLDDAHPMPHALRWSEVQAIADHLEQAEGLPTEPRLALLLLAPFAAVTEDEDGAAVTRELGGALSALGLLDPVEVEVAASLPLLRRFPWAAEGDHARWVADPVVGWRLDGVGRVGDLELPLAHSLRRADVADFPAAALLALLRGVGVSDLPGV